MLPGGDEPDNRRMLGAEGIKSAANSPVYARLRELNAVRRASPALQKGSQKKLYAQKDQYVFRRDYGKSRAFVFLNKAAYPARLTIPAVPDGTYTELYTGARVTVKRGAVMEVPPHGVRVLAN